SRSMSSRSSAGVRPGLSCGRLDRSVRVSADPARATHLRTVRALIPKAAATCPVDWCSATMRRTISARLWGVVRAFLWTVIHASSCGVELCWHTQVYYVWLDVGAMLP